MLATICETVLRKNTSLILPKSDNNVNYEESLASIIKSLLTNSIQKSSQIAVFNLNPTDFILIKEIKKAFATSCSIVFLKLLMAATSRSYISCGTLGAISTRTLRPRLNKSDNWLGLANLEVGKSTLCSIRFYLIVL